MSCSTGRIDLPGVTSDFAHVNRSITIDARWDGEAAVWIATSNDVPGLVVEAEHWDDMITEVRLVLPDLLELSGQKIH